MAFFWKLLCIAAKLGDREVTVVVLPKSVKSCLLGITTKTFNVKEIYDQNKFYPLKYSLFSGL